MWLKGAMRQKAEKKIRAGVTYLRGCFSSGFSGAPLERVLRVFEDAVHVPCELVVPSGGGVLDQAEFSIQRHYFYK